MKFENQSRLIMDLMVYTFGTQNLYKKLVNIWYDKHYMIN